MRGDHDGVAEADDEFVEAADAVAAGEFDPEPVTETVPVTERVLAAVEETVRTDVTVGTRAVRERVVSADGDTVVRDDNDSEGVADDVVVRDEFVDADGVPLLRPVAEEDADADMLPDRVSLTEPDRVTLDEPEAEKDSLGLAVADGEVETRDVRVGKEAVAVTVATAEEVACADCVAVPVTLVVALTRAVCVADARVVAVALLVARTDPDTGADSELVADADTVAEPASESVGDEDSVGDGDPAGDAVDTAVDVAFTDALAGADCVAVEHDESDGDSVAELVDDASTVTDALEEGLEREEGVSEPLTHDDCEGVGDVDGDPEAVKAAEVVADAEMVTVDVDVVEVDCVWMLVAVSVAFDDAVEDPLAVVALDGDVEADPHTEKRVDALALPLTVKLAEGEARGDIEGVTDMLDVAEAGDDGEAACDTVERALADSDRADVVDAVTVTVAAGVNGTEGEGVDDGETRRLDDVSGDEDADAARLSDGVSEELTVGVEDRLDDAVACAD